MDFAERLVSLAYQSLGYFVIEGASAGQKQADLLAVRIDAQDCVSERLHIEVQVSVNPVGVLRGQGALSSAAAGPEQAAGDYIQKKFLDVGLVSVVQQRLGSQDYTRVFVHGRLNDKAQLDVFRARGIECVPIGRLIAKALSTKPVCELKRQVLVADLLKITEA